MKTLIETLVTEDLMGPEEVDVAFALVRAARELYDEGTPTPTALEVAKRVNKNGYRITLVDVKDRMEFVKTALSIHRKNKANAK